MLPSLPHFLRASRIRGVSSRVPVLVLVDERGVTVHIKPVLSTAANVGTANNRKNLRMKARNILICRPYL